MWSGDVSRRSGVLQQELRHLYPARRDVHATVLRGWLNAGAANRDCDSDDDYRLLADVGFRRTEFPPDTER